MDDLQLPEELKDLWTDPHPPKENVDMIVEQVLRSAQKFKAIHHNWDVIHVTLAVVLILPVLLAVAEFDPRLLPGVAAMALLYAVCLFNMRRFYGSVGREPTPNRTTQEHLAWTLTYLDHRERLYRANGRWGDVGFPIAAILTAVGMFRSEPFSRVEPLVLIALLAAGWWAGNAMTKSVLRQIAEERARVRKMCDDLAG